MGNWAKAVNRGESTPKPAKSVAKPRKRKSPVRSPNQPDSSPTSQDQPLSVREFFAARLGVDEDRLPRMKFGEIRKIADVDIPTLHGWVYLSRELPEAAITRLHEYFAEYVRRME